MKLQSVNIKNFRCFEDITIDFHERLTVLVGGNGSGKSAVLDALSEELASIMRAYINFSHSYTQHSFTISDIHKRIRTNLPFFAFSLEMPHKKIQHDVNFLLRDSGQLTVEGNSCMLFHSLMRDAENRKDSQHSIFIYYQAKRLVSDTKFHKLTKISERHDAYINMVAKEIDVQSSLAWFDSKDAEQARERDERRENGNDELYTIPELKAVKEAIESVLQDYVNPRMKWTPPELVVSEKSQPQNVISLEQLSDGYRTMLALVMDLARRMAIANAEEYNRQGKSVLESPAIVLIDEVDLHLHPSWQQRVLPDLMRTFPNTQFIVTTHSPQVLSSVAREHIRILKNGKASLAEWGTLGAESSRVLEDVFGVPTRPEEIMFNTGNRMKHYDLDANIKRYFHLISEDKYDSDEAKAIRNALEDIMPDDPMLARADAQIERARRLHGRRARHA